MNKSCPDLEQVFVELAEGQGEALEHARACQRCSRMIEQHQQLEHALFRLEDPFPPADLLPHVMAKVAAAPVPMQREVWTGIAIMTAAIVLGVVSLVLSGNAAWFGVATASTVIDLKVLVSGLGDGLAAAWKTAALPTFALLVAVLALGLFGLKQLVGAGTLAHVKVRATR
jgi:hypothetical protein